MTSESARKILVCVDGSEHSDRCLKFYCEQLSRPHDDLFILSVFTAPNFSYGISYPGPFQFPDEYQVMMTEKINAAKSMLSEYKAKVNEHIKALNLSISVHLKLVTSNDHGVAGTIAYFGEENGINLIVIGSRGLNAVKRAFVGSVSSSLTHHSRHIPVVIVPK